MCEPCGEGIEPPPAGLGTGARPGRVGDPNLNRHPEELVAGHRAAGLDILGDGADIEPL